MDGDWDRLRATARRHWVVIESHRNPQDELVRLYRDMAIARARVEEALQDLARRHGIRTDRIAMAMESCADDLLNTVVGELKSRLSGDLETQSSRGHRATTIREIRPATLALPATESPGVSCSLPGRRTNAAASGRAVLPTDAELNGSAGPVPVGGPAACVHLPPPLPVRP
jgi:hypothetical protein